MYVFIEQKTSTPMNLSKTIICLQTPRKSGLWIMMMMITVVVVVVAAAAVVVVVVVIVDGTYSPFEGHRRPSTCSPSGSMFLYVYIFIYTYIHTYTHI